MQARQIFAKDNKNFYRFYGFPFLYFFFRETMNTLQKKEGKKQNTKQYVQAQDYFRHV